MHDSLLIPLAVVPFGGSRVPFACGSDPHQPCAQPVGALGWGCLQLREEQCSVERPDRQRDRL